MQVQNKTVLVDGAPFLFRGVAYSPTPIGIAPDEEQSLDFFTDQFAAIYERDLPRMAAAGVNAIRIYDIRPECRRSPCRSEHSRFFRACNESGIVVMGGFELSAAEYDLRVDYDVEGGLHGFETLKSKLNNQLRFLREPEPEAGELPSPIIMWTVGNEINLPQNGFICDVNQTHSPCQYEGHELARLIERSVEL